MRLDLIETFLAVVKRKSLSQASEILFVSQSTVSQRLKSLEATLGIRLVERGKGCRYVKLTPEGEEFVCLAEKWTDLLQKAQTIKQGSSKILLSIASPDSLNNYLFFPLFEKLAHKVPPLFLHIRTQQSIEVYDILEKREIDLGFSFRNIRYETIAVKPVFQEKMLIAYKAGTNWPSGPIHPSQLDPKKEISLPWNPEIDFWHEHWWGPNSKPLVRVDTAAMILKFLSNPHYWAICPFSVARAFQEEADIETRELSVPVPPRICYLLLHRSPNESSVKNIDLFIHHFELFIKDAQLSKFTEIGSPQL